jgi:hypothetical protein
MTSRGDYWTEWEWNAERQKLRRELRDYRGRYDCILFYDGHDLTLVLYRQSITGTVW